MTGEILCIGTELLLGDIINTNAAYLAQRLSQLGIDVYHQSVVGDNPGRIRQALELALSRAELVITTGGLGPTCDDISKEMAAELFGLPLEEHEPSLRHLENFFEKIGREMTPNNRKQALLPRGAQVFANGEGTAPGFAVEKQGKIILMLPGPPREMKAMFEQSAAGYLAGFSQSVLHSTTVHIFGMGESAVEQQLRPIMEASQNPTLAPYAKEGEVQLRITAKAGDKAQAQALIAPMLEKLRATLGELIYGIDVGNLQTALVQALRQRGLHIATAESCTGGLAAQRITQLPGASQVFDMGVCSYSNQAKQQLLGVDPKTLEQQGAVSAEVAGQMAAGVRKAAGADIGLSITGIAGPEGGSPQKPVGLVYVAVDSPWHSQVLELYLSRGGQSDRLRIRHMACMYALHLALRTAQKHPQPPKEDA